MSVAVAHDAAKDERIVPAAEAPFSEVNDNGSRIVNPRRQLAEWEGNQGGREPSKTDRTSQWAASDAAAGPQTVPVRLRLIHMSTEPAASLRSRVELGGSTRCALAQISCRATVRVRGPVSIRMH